MSLKIFLAVLFLLPSGLVFADELPLRDFFRNAEVIAFQLSPDGKKISYRKPWESRMNLFIRDRATGRETRVTSIKDRDLSEYHWKGNDTILYQKDIGGDENFHTFAVDLKTGKERDLTPFPKTRSGFLDDLDRVSPTDVLIDMNKRNPGLFDVYRLNVRTGALRLEAENVGGVTEWYIDNRGEVRGAKQSAGLNYQLLFRKSKKDNWKKIFTYEDRDTFFVVSFTPDNRNLYVISSVGRDKAALVEFDPRQSKEIRILYQNPDYDISGAFYSKEKKKLILTSYSGWKRERAFFDTEWEKVYNKFLTHSPGYEFTSIENDRAEDAFIFRRFKDSDPGAFYLYDRKKDEFELLGLVAPWFKGKKLASMKPVSYMARDGLKIEGYLTVPPGKEEKNLPVIVFPHGGPWARVSWRNSSEVQFLANRGYAVLEMNFRGSTGYGKHFLEAADKEWGGKMQDDITDGAQWLIQAGIADPKKICIYGGSYGGYAALAGVAFTPGLYACAVDYVGISNLFTFLKTIPPYWKPMIEKLYAKIGDPEKDADMLRARSPVFHVEKIKTPLLVVQGANDPRVNKAESDQIVEALRKRGLEVEYLVKENEGHGFQNEENRFEFYEAMERFLKKHLK